MMSKMSRVLVSALTVLFLFPAFCSAANIPATGISGTPHDFANPVNTGTSGGANGIPNNVGGVGLCTYCHTPHKALSTLLLWNHTLSSNTFSWDVAKTTAGTTFPTFAGNTYKGPTAKCLSCHDGSVAVGDIAWYKEGNRQGVNALNNFTMGQTAPNGDDTSHFVVGSGGAMAGNHPVAMPYPYNNLANTYNGSSTGAAAVLTEWQATPVSNGSPAYIRLFNDDGSGNISAGAVAGKTGIECSSCHDPHNKSTVDDWFLRGNITGASQADGYICLQCHIK